MRIAASRIALDTVLSRCQLFFGRDGSYHGIDRTCTAHQCNCGRLGCPGLACYCRRLKTFFHDSRVGSWPESTLFLQTGFARQRNKPTYKLGKQQNRRIRWLFKKQRSVHGELFCPHGSIEVALRHLVESKNLARDHCQVASSSDPPSPKIQTFFQPITWRCFAICARGTSTAHLG